jgi:hypothetical protein
MITTHITEPGNSAVSSSNTPFVLPTGAVLDQSDGTLSISYDGDIILEQSCSLPIGRIQAGGDILLRMDNVQGTIIAGGRLIINGNVDAEWLHGSEIHISRRVFQESVVRAKYITAIKRVVICDTEITADMVLAPKLEIDKKTTGVVNVVDCHHKVDLPNIKGKIRLVEHQNSFGNIDTLVDDDGLHAFFSTKTGIRFLAVAKGEHYEPDVEIKTDYTDISEADKGVDDSYFDDTGIDATGVSDPVPQRKNPFFQRRGDASESIISDATNTASIPPTGPQHEKVLSEPKTSRQESSSKHNDKLVVIERNQSQESGSNVALHAALTEHLEALLAMYPSPPPPPIESVKNHIHTDNIVLLRQEITAIWKELVAWHNSTKTPPNKQVAGLFKKINATLRRP